MVIKINFYDISSSLYYDFRHNILFFSHVYQGFSDIEMFFAGDVHQARGIIVGFNNNGFIENSV